MDQLNQTATQVMTQGQALWHRIFVPIGQRLLDTLPVIVHALVVLLAFWLLARALGALVTKVLGMLRLDERAQRDWGLSRTLTSSTGGKRSIERWAGVLTKWVIVLFGVVAFLQILNLNMVASPLESILANVLGVVPNVLRGLLTLLIYWIVASLAKAAIAKSLAAISFDDRVHKYFPSQRIRGERVSPSTMISRLFFYGIVLFGVPPFLEALGQVSLVHPLQDMLSKALAFLPNLFAAAVILFLGMALAVVVREMTSRFISGVGTDAKATELGIDKMVGNRHISQIVGTIFYFFILVPVLVSAVDTLGIKAISEPVKHTLERILAAVPSVLVATLVTVIGYLVARVVRGLVATFLSGVGFDALPQKLGLNFLKTKKEGSSLSSVGGTVVMAVILLLTAQQALATLGMDQLATVVGTLVMYLPRFFVGTVVLFAALSIGSYVGNLVLKATAGSVHNELTAAVAKYAIVFFGASITMTQFGIGQDIVTIAVACVMGGASLALGLAFGLGGKEKARDFLEKGSRHR